MKEKRNLMKKILVLFIVAAITINAVPMFFGDLKAQAVDSQSLNAVDEETKLSWSDFRTNDGDVMIHYMGDCQNAVDESNSTVSAEAVTTATTLYYKTSTDSAVQAEISVSGSAVTGEALSAAAVISKNNDIVPDTEYFGNGISVDFADAKQDKLVFAMRDEGRYTVELNATGESVVSKNIVIDNTAPIVESIEITPSEGTVVTNNNGNKVLSGNGDLTITVSDENFNQNNVELSCDVKDNLGTDSVTATENIEWIEDTENNRWVGTVTISDEGNYNVSFSCADFAGNVSQSASVDFIIDPSPTVEITYENKTATTVNYIDTINLDENGNVTKKGTFKEATNAYYNGSVAAKIRVNDNDFDLEGKTHNQGTVLHSMNILVEKTLNDGSVIYTEYKPEDSASADFSDVTESAIEEKIEWVKDENEDNSYYSEIVFDTDADYRLYVRYADYANNESEIKSGDSEDSVFGEYKSKVITVDTIKPEIKSVSFEGLEQEISGINYYKKAKATIVVEEHNFSASSVAAAITAKDITDNDIAGVNKEKLLNTLLNMNSWKHEGDIHTAELIFDEEARYTFEIAGQDISGNNAEYNGNEKYSSGEFVVDKTNPENVEITYSENIVSKFLGAITFGFYKEEVEVTIKSSDNIAGIEGFEWKYTADEENLNGDSTSKGNKESTEYEKITQITYSENGKDAVASFKIPAQARGYVTVTAYDKSGNGGIGSSTEKNEQKNIHTIEDSIAPQVSVTYSMNKASKVQFINADEEDLYGNTQVVNSFEEATDVYYNGSVTAKILVNEENFDFEGKTTDDGNVIHNVGIMLQMTDENGAVTYTEYKPKNALNYSFSQTDMASNDSKEIEWNRDSESGNYYIEINYDTDADYKLIIEYTDLSDNKAEITSDDRGDKTGIYMSKTITVDTKKPVVDVKYSDIEQTAGNVSYYKNTVATITVSEHNFRSSDILSVITAKDISGNTLSGINVADMCSRLINKNAWKDNGNNTYTSQISFNKDARYNFNFNYKDISGNEADNYSSGEFVVDEINPDKVKIIYSENVLEKIISGITFGYYKSKVTVTLESNDNIAGIEYFQWKYIQENGTSNINKASTEYEKIAVAKRTNNRKTATSASFDIPAQVRGKIVATAYDYSKNGGEKTSTERDDSARVNVVDTIAPTMTAEYTAANRQLGNRLYYNHDLTAVFTVNEANFYSEDVVVKVSKNGGEAYRISPNWSDRSTDVHVGTYTIAAPYDHSSDGDYVFTVEYTDRSTNQMVTYASNIFVIDTIKPVINVEYSNQNIINTLQDNENRNRNYYDSVQTATVTINEHNFKDDEVNFTILAYDVAGNAIDSGMVSSFGGWEHNGDSHSIIITYPGDANYTFDVAYTDLSVNEADDYNEDYFTVDTTVPGDLTISYSNSVLETVLDNLSFGFYNSKMTVTISAYDNISSVHSFKYDYEKAIGVSNVNSELLGQIIEEAEITYSDGGTRATATFSVPQDVLTDVNQFNGTMNFNAADRSGNTTDYYRDAKHIVVDNIAPNAQIKFNDPVNEMENVSYYNGDIKADITVTEANFDSSDVIVSVTKNDGQSERVTTSWDDNDNSTDVHIGHFTLTEPGYYWVTVNYTDKSGNQMPEYKWEKELTIDTDNDQPAINIKFDGQDAKNASGAACTGEAVLEIYLHDENYESCKIKSMTKTSVDIKNLYKDEAHTKPNLDNFEKNVLTGETEIGSITKENIDYSVVSGFAVQNGYGSKDEKNGKVSFSLTTGAASDDGIYRVEVATKDKANHENTNNAVFTVNRNGSVYEFNESLIDVMENYYVSSSAIKDDFVITEYNANEVTAAPGLSVTCHSNDDKDKIIDIDFEPSTKGIGDNGWNKYDYSMAKDKFSTEGTYIISVSTKDAAGNPSNNTKNDTNYNKIESPTDNADSEMINVSESKDSGDSNDKKGEEIQFCVDNTEPTINTIYVDISKKQDLSEYTEKDKEKDKKPDVVDAGNSTVRFTVRDAGFGIIDTAEITVDGKSVYSYKNSDNSHEPLDGKFDVNESTNTQEIVISVKDKAGNNITKTYYLLLTTNPFARLMALLMANTPLFVVSIIAFVAVLAGAVFGIFYFIRRRKAAKQS